MFTARAVNRLRVVACASHMRGQALVLGMIALLVLCIGVIVLFNTGQAVNKKVQLVNAADAAAYSAAVQQARAYNLVAYMNRAEVANEVAVAQFVSWYSWMNFALRGTDNFKDAVQAIAILFDISIVGAEVGTMLQEVVTVLNEVKTVVQKTRDVLQKALSVATTAIAILNDAYSKASQVITVGEALEAQKIVPDIVAKNTDGKAKLDWRGRSILMKGITQAITYTRRYHISTRSADRDGSERFANVVMEARDGFSKQRNGSFGPIKKRGGTDLIDYKNWVGIDTLNVRFKWGCGFWGCLINLNVPLAWGGGAAVKNPPQESFRSLASPGYHSGSGWDAGYETDKRHYAPYSGALRNNAASSLVLRSPAMGGSDKVWIKTYGTAPGLQDYDDIDPNKATVPYLNGKSAADNGVEANDVGPIFTVLVEQPMNTVHTSDNLDGLGSTDAPATSASSNALAKPNFKVPDKTLADQMTAVGSAQVYFSRPRSLFANLVSPGRRELGSLFSPYWQARLVDTPCSVRHGIEVLYAGSGVTPVPLPCLLH
ncbi:pilus assembly protein TadG-related protein [Oleiagrimonas sp. MCCC 1A03011]|uniref:pilus assembly protein TadG-related protein n=1 Tax=Oleiagrimonas sp. MCCC 1A03011 TaxID=1926883 RepID=UPI000DC3B050|nr:pilus assembly protein TadG-related protein [Oleiagrimonas sp. MCCC 1A03011]RAP58151.1 hypothetical protein BTJ49_03980 [Oleiagrimonas sp. MCCC 1A03011]